MHITVFRDLQFIAAAGLFSTPKLEIDNKQLATTLEHEPVDAITLIWKADLWSDILSAGDSSSDS